ncbi:hypothetical protein [Nocardioides sambongensis]|uniref:hypothetical protein n=1 Tax=Nocardioides sambongensis TaxID=2589074 RepID=UPI00112BDCAF|nr:hypothetical protein [Nocardioides sambongensis]
MEPLREVFARLAAGGSGAGEADALAGLEPELVAEALVGYADTAPIEVAEHLEGFVTGATAGDADADAVRAGLDLLAHAPRPGDEELADDLLGPAVPTDPTSEPASDSGPAADLDGELGSGLDLGFGTGTTEIDLPTPEDVAEVADEPAAASDPEPGTDDPPFDDAAAGGWLDLGDPAAPDGSEGDGRDGEAADDAETGE